VRPAPLKRTRVRNRPTRKSQDQSGIGRRKRAIIRESFDMKYLIACLCALASPPTLLLAQAPVDSTIRLTYRFEQPTQTALQLATKGLAVLDGELLRLSLQRGDSIVELIGQVRTNSWATNPVVRGATKTNGSQIEFGRLQSYLRGDRRFRVLVIPASCQGCQGDLTVSLLPYADSTGFLVQGRRSPKPR